MLTISAPRGRGERRSFKIPFVHRLMVHANRESIGCIHRELRARTIAYRSDLVVGGQDGLLAPPATGDSHRVYSSSYISSSFGFPNP